MSIANIGRNDLCPCGSGKKFKKCHFGREDELLQKKLEMEAGDLAVKLATLPVVEHQRAREMADHLHLTTGSGKPITFKFVDLAAYWDMAAADRQQAAPSAGAMLINPRKYRALEPTTLYMAISPGVDDYILVHELAHAADLIAGSRLPMGVANELASDHQLPIELLEHPQEFGERLVSLSESLGVSLDADDEIVAFLARRKLLLTGKQIAAGQGEELVASAEKAMRALRENREEIDARIKVRPGYTGQTAQAPASPEEEDAEDLLAR